MNFDIDDHKKFLETEFTEDQHRLFNNPNYMTDRKKLNSNLIIHSVLRPLAIIITMFSFYLLFTGHNAPGGGFVAGLTSAACLVLIYVNFGSSIIRKKITFDFKYLIAIGLACTMILGLGSVFFGFPFLTQTFGEITFPFFGTVNFSTSLIFDIGIFLIVTGSCITIITSIGQSEGPEKWKS